MKRLFFVIISLSLCEVLSSHAPDSVKYQSLEPYDFHLRYLKEDIALLIDVREYFEFKGRRIKGSVNIPASGNLEFSTDTIDKNCALFFYCLTDERSIHVAEYFYERGFRKLYSLQGGIIAWRKDRFPVVRGTGRKKK